MCIIQLFLRNDLKNFGLNPLEWTIHELNKQTFKVAFIDDKQFFFVGETQTVGPFQKWKNLKLISL